MIWLSTCKYNIVIMLIVIPVILTRLKNSISQSQRLFACRVWKNQHVLLSGQDHRVPIETVDIIVVPPFVFSIHT